MSDKIFKFLGTSGAALLRSLFLSMTLSMMLLVQGCGTQIPPESIHLEVVTPTNTLQQGIDYEARISTLEGLVPTERLTIQILSPWTRAVVQSFTFNLDQGVNRDATGVMHFSAHEVHNPRLVLKGHLLRDTISADQEPPAFRALGTLRIVDGRSTIVQAHIDGRI